MIRPLTTNPNQPAQLYKEFEFAASKAAHGVQAFKMLMLQEENRAIIDRAQVSTRENGHPENVWRVTSHPDWYDRDEAMADRVVEQDKDAQHNDLINAGDNFMEEGDDGTILANFKNANEKLSLHWNEEQNLIEVHLPSPANIRFEIRTDSEGPTKYRVTAKGSSNLYASILRSIAARPHPNSLKYLLELLASYHDIKSRPCATCGKLLDKEPQLPSVRRSQATKDTDSHTELLWEAYHEACA
ncbi:MAG: hypothetical protein M1819_003765 [Sarea resinae]|nr:MAG: hypothetical protein M1819_003765 [Sarea resinae]